VHGGCAGPIYGVDLHQDRVARDAFAYERCDRRITGVTTIPIGFAVDLDGLKQSGQACRSKQDVRRQLRVVEHTPTASAYIGRRHKEFDRSVCNALEVDAFGQDFAQWVRTARIEIVRRENARGEIESNEDGRCIDRPTP